MVTQRIEDYALIGDSHTAALVGKNGSIDWLCAPRFDSDAVFAALLGTPENGRWQLAPAGGVRKVERQYRGDTLVLETTFDTDDGVVRVIDFMPIRQARGRGRPHRRGRLGSGPDAHGPPYPIRLRIGRAVGRAASNGTAAGDRRSQRDAPHLADAPPKARGHATVADFVVEAGDRVPFVLTWYPSHEEPPHPGDPVRSLRDTVSLVEPVVWRRHVHRRRSANSSCGH